MKIHKYRLDPGCWNRIPADKIIHFGPDPKGTICAWGEADPENIAAKWEVCVLGTGWDMPEGPIKHLGSCLADPYVWHLYGREL